MQTGLEIETDICIIGAGAAGITMAKLLDGTSLKVCLLESGGLEYEVNTQELYEGAVVGLRWTDARLVEGHEDQKGPELSVSRLRFFGGSTNHWGAGCAQLNEIDFRKRPWVPHSGWPIGKSDLLPYYELARPLLQITPGATHQGGEIPFNPGLFSYYRDYHAGVSSSPIRFGTAYRSDIERAKNVFALLHANLVELKVNEEASSVAHAEFRSLGGKRGTVRARIYVLACGGIENARLLLLSNSVVPRGLGNEHDLVGRFFMDHPRGVCGRIATAKTSWETPPFEEILASEPLQRRDFILQGRTRLIDREDGEIADGILAVRELEAAFVSRTVPNNLGKTILRIASDLGDVMPGVYHRLKGENVVPAHYLEVESEFEQAPNPESRVTLGDDMDALGQRRVRLDWRLTELDLRTYRAVALQFAQEIGRLNLGRMRLAPWVDPNAEARPPELGGASHHMGTTRMSDDPTSGVVDRNCRVHGISNLFVAGSSCFPTSSWALPTWTIVAMTIRLTDHIKNVMPAFSG